MVQTLDVMEAQFIKVLLCFCVVELLVLAGRNPCLIQCHKLFSVSLYFALGLSLGHMMELEWVLQTAHGVISLFNIAVTAQTHLVFPCSLLKSFFPPLLSGCNANAYVGWFLALFPNLHSSLFYDCKQALLCFRVTRVLIFFSFPCKL